MRKKLLTLALTLVMGVSAIIAPTVSAATPNRESLDKMKELITSAASQPKANLSAVAATDNVAAIQIGIPDAFLNGKKTFIDTKNKKVVPIIKSGRTMIPLRFCASAMGGTTTYISDKDFITVKVNGKVAKFKIGSKALKITDNAGKVLKNITLDVAAAKVNGRVMVPTRAISEGLGSKVFYQKIGKDEFVLVSQYSLSIYDKNYQFALLQNLKTYTFTDHTKSYKVKLSGACTKSSEKNGLASFSNILWGQSSVQSQVIDAADANQFLNFSKSDWEEMLGESISELTKTTINGKKAVTLKTVLHIKSDDEFNGRYICDMFLCIIASQKAGLMIKGMTEGDEESFFPECKNFYTNITMLK